MGARVAPDRGPTRGHRTGFTTEVYNMSDATPANPDASEPDEPKGFLNKIGAALPIGLTALATVFAGMSTGALQQAMYWKSQAAQDQSKATNQWTLAGFKVDRALVMQTAAAQLSVAAGGKVPEFAPDSTSADQKVAAEWLEGKGPPDVYRRGADAKRREGRVGLPDVSAALQELLEMIRKRAPEEDIAKRAARIPKAEINKAINDAEAESEKITEDEWAPKVDAARKLVGNSRKKGSDLATAAQAALFELERRRYRSEATLNQEIAALYEARVRTASAESDKHRNKSETLFIAMLVAQIGGVVSSLALARKNKSALWLFASMVGLAALGVGAYGVLSALLPN